MCRFFDFPKGMERYPVHCTVSYMCIISTIQYIYESFDITVIEITAEITVSYIDMHMYVRTYL